MTGLSQHGKPVILLVEDNPADVRLACEVLEEAGVADGMLVARDGDQAMRMVRRDGEYADLPRPDLILLDLNLPRLSGHEVLAQIKQTPGLRRIPVIVLTTSRAESDISACYEAHANAFLTKPVDLLEFSRLATMIRDFWLGAVQLPQRSAV
jgi:two-component system, chemotaxis family, response regulator Rcp1